VALEVDARTIRRDLEYMRDQLHTPIGFDRVERGFFYTERTFRLAFPQLSQGELVALFLAERMMHQFRGTSFEPDLRQGLRRGDEEQTSNFRGAVRRRTDSAARILRDQPE
jgi:predicted DNA-binding transcriptional regulator YafY